jgi:HK97 family phage major capsid protein
MIDIHTKKARLTELHAEVKSLMRNRMLTPDQKHTRLDQIEAEDNRITTEIKNYQRALDARLGNEEYPPPLVGSKAMRGRPLEFDPAHLKAMHQAVMSRQSFQIHTKDFNSPISQLPPQLYPGILGPIHENRLMERLPTLPIEAPSLEYIRHTGTTGVPAVTAEGAVKPELVFAIDKLIATPLKVACHAATTWETMTDMESFVSYMQNEVFKEIEDTENYELLNGTGAGHIPGFFQTTGIVTHNAATDTGTNETALDSVEKSIAKMRMSSALAEPDMLILNPLTWSAMRRIKNTLGQFLIAPDPTADEVNKLWGLDVIVTIAQAEGFGLLLDNSKWGHVIVREALSMRTGTDSDDFTRNLVRFVFEERFTVAVERPTAVCEITNLPAPTFPGS